MQISMYQVDAFTNELSKRGGMFYSKLDKEKVYISGEAIQFFKTNFEIDLNE